MDSLLRFENVSFSYHSEHDSPDGLQPTALSNINVTIRSGEVVAILGHNGSGKSTFAKLCNGIIKPTGGKVYVNGIDTSDDNNLLAVRQVLGMVFQNPDNQLVATVVEEDVAFALENLGVKSEEIRARVDEALEAVGMSEYKEHAPHRLSGGQKQRVAIAGIIAMRPSCIVMDEPTAMLDPEGRREVLETIKKLNSELGITIVIITHHMNEAALCDRVIVMDHGHVLIDDTPRKVFAEYELLKHHSLTVPQTVELTHFAGLPPALTIAECVEQLYTQITGG